MAALLLWRQQQQQRGVLLSLARSFSTKLFVGGLSFRTDEEAVRNAFAAHGEVVEVKLISDRETGRSKGFGFVTFESDADADTAISQMSGKLLDGRTIRVDKAASRPPLPSTRSFGGFDSGMDSSSSLPPVAEDWGTIPSNIAFINTASSPSPSPPTSSPAMVEPSSTTLGGALPAGPSSTAFGGGQSSSVSPSPFDNATFGAAAFDSKPFDSSTFGAASFNSSSTTSVSFNSSSSSSSSSTTPSVQSTTISSSSSSTTTFGLPDMKQASEPGGIGDSTTASSPSSSVTTSPSSNIPPSTQPATPLNASPTTPSVTTPTSPLTSSGKFDFSNFSFDSGSYRDNDPPLPRRRPRPRPQTSVLQRTTTSNFNANSSSAFEARSPFGSSNAFAETAIPRPKGPELDFGLLDITARSRPGARPQGGFDTNIPDDLPEAPPVQETTPKPKPPGFSIFPQRTLPSLELPWDTPEADNWSEIGEDPPKYDLSSLFPSMGTLLKKDKEFHWDPYDFDEEAKLPPEPEATEEDSDFDWAS